MSYWAIFKLENQSFNHSIEPLARSTKVDTIINQLRNLGEQYYMIEQDFDGNNFITDFTSIIFGPKQPLIIDHDCRPLK